jgi:hypothetical protein
VHGLQRLEQRGITQVRGFTDADCVGICCCRLILPLAALLHRKSLLKAFTKVADVDDHSYASFLCQYQHQLDWRHCLSHMKPDSPK